MSAMQKSKDRDVVFLIVCALGYGLVTMLVPPYVGLIEPDSASYIHFQPNRSVLHPVFLLICQKLGLSFVQITWLQSTIFCFALICLLAMLRRSEFPQALLAILVAVLAANVLFSSFHRSILTESLYFSLSVFAMGLWTEYFRTGRPRHLISVSVLLGFMTGLRPVAMALIPMQVVAVLIRRPERIARALLIVVALPAVGVGVGSERLLYRYVHNASP